MRGSGVAWVVMGFIGNVFVFSSICSVAKNADKSCSRRITFRAYTPIGATHYRLGDDIESGGCMDTLLSCL